jgi:tRNA A37 threonylcarbamoyladenosine modification protein TsaB
VGTAKAWAWTKNIPLVGFSSLAFLARSMVVPLQAQGRGGASTLLIAASDACQGEVYALIGSPQAVKDCVAMADGDNPGIWKRGVSEEVHLIPQFQKEIHRRWKKRLSNKKGMDAWVGIGEAFEKNTDLAGVLPAKNRIRPEIQHVRSGSVMAQMVWEAYQMGLGRDPSHVRLRYLRASDAEVKLKAGKLKVNALR